MGKFEFQNSSPSLIKMWEFTQAAPQKQPKYLTVAAPSQLRPQSMPRIHVGSTCLSSDSTAEQGQQKLRARTDTKKMKELAPKPVGVESWRPAPAGHWTSVCGWHEPSSGGSSALPHGEARILVWVEGNTHTQREQSQLSWPSGRLLLACEVGDSNWVERKSYLTPGASFRPFTPPGRLHPPSWEQPVHPGKDATCLHF